MQDAGARAFTLHARTRTQMYSGKANWDEIARVVEALDIPVIGNGDVQTPEDVVRMRDHTGCGGRDGRPRRVRQPVALPRRAGAARGRARSRRRRARRSGSSSRSTHARLALRLQGDSRHTVVEFRKHLGWYTKGLHGASELRQRLFQVESFAEAEEIFVRYLAPLAQVA